MSTEASGIRADRGLCQQCRILFSSEGFSQLLRSNRFKHSKLGTFPERPDCRFCSYLWNEDFMGGSSQVLRVRRLRDLIYPPSGGVKLGNKHDLLLSWVVITRPIRDQYITGMSGAVANLEPLTIDIESIQTKGVDRIFITVESDKGRIKWQAFRPLRLVVPQDSPLASFTNFRPVKWSGLTTDWANDVKAMLEHCRTSHPQCQPSGLTRLPSRLLHISGKGEAFPTVQLHITAERVQTGQYAALSYCWGGPQPLELTKSNLNTLRERAIDYVSLPETLKDAVRVVYSLGLSYLWVDALCIIQDDPEDKRREIGQMCAIYQNSFVTIAAATSSSVHESFLNNTSTFNMKHPMCTIHVALDSEHNQDPESLSSLTIAPVHAHRTDIFPLNKRGWTFQEALLPRRLLVFGDLEPFVRCRTKNVMKKSWSFIDYELSAVHPRRVIDSIANSQAHDSGLIVDTKGGDLEYVWREIVEQYTLRELSFAEDRPLAISGVIDFLSNTFKDECYFGVWKSCPVTGLLWKAVAPGERTTIPGMPTWSWMSITGAVDLDSVVFFGKPEALVEWGSDPSRARLLISCCILKGEEVQSEDEDEDGRTTPGILLEGWSDFSEGTAAYDFLPGSDSYYLVLARETNGHFLAIVAACQGDNVYHRCGLAELNLPGGWRSRPREQIILA